LRKLARRSQLARREGLFLLDGVHLFEEALAAGICPAELMISPRLLQSARGRQLRHSLAEHGWRPYLLSDALMDRIAPTTTPQGVLGLFPRDAVASGGTDSALPTAGPAVVLVLAGLQDPANLGALARCARALGCRYLVTTVDSVDPYHVRALRASSGALLHVTVLAGLPSAELASWRDAAGATLVALMPRADAALCEVIAGAAAHKPLALVLGSEGRGLTPEIAGLCQQRGAVPMTGAAESLSVVAAGTIALYIASARAQ
jgi:TrmH family RNA methyltransferase